MARSPQQRANRRLAKSRQPIVSIFSASLLQTRVQRLGTKLRALATTPAVAAHGGTIALQKTKGVDCLSHRVRLASQAASVSNRTGSRLVRSFHSRVHSPSATPLSSRIPSKTLPTRRLFLAQSYDKQHRRCGRSSLATIPDLRCMRSDSSRQHNGVEWSWPASWPG